MNKPVTLFSNNPEDNHSYNTWGQKLHAEIILCCLEDAMNPVVEITNVSCILSVWIVWIVKFNVIVWNPMAN